MNKQQSFTLIELLVVIVIIGILAGVIMISTSSSIDKANIAKSKVFEESVQNNLVVNMVSSWNANNVTKNGTSWILIDEWGNDINGTFYNAESIICAEGTACPQIIFDTQMGNVLSFDGVDDSIRISRISSFPRGDRDVTYSAYINIHSYTDNYYDIIIGWPWTDETALCISAENKLSFDMYGQDVNRYSYRTLSTVSLNKWYYFVASYNSADDSINLYIDGKLDKRYETIISPPRIAGYTAFYIGTGAATTYVGTHAFNGLIGEMKVYDGALSSAQIKKKYITNLNSMFVKGTISNKEYNERINELAYDK
ncbi:MAG TPA: prepilin-type N-terminal cleavage/methylation domain-containing protein [Candidatus Pacearchaeota archaeon]|mgnify:CR=1 FL=1|nr:prepilin-type N-terminal cleavage/methylation domain-containing protein [Candidatus Pacearchaeota archaeon]